MVVGEDRIVGYPVFRSVSTGVAPVPDFSSTDDPTRDWKTSETRSMVQVRGSPTVSLHHGASKVKGLQSKGTTDSSPLGKGPVRVRARKVCRGGRRHSV